MEKTVFEKIIAREIPAEILYEDELTCAFLDNAPTTPGHTLVIPKKPFVNIFDCDEETIAAVARTIRLMAPAVRDAVGAKGVHVNSNHGAEAGQVVFHMHFHIIPRHSRDEFEFWAHYSYDTDAQATEMADKIRAQIK
jgi:histidine triad (HIT) family protein